MAFRPAISISGEGLNQSAAGESRGFVSGLMSLGESLNKLGGDVAEAKLAHTANLNDAQSIIRSAGPRSTDYAKNLAALAVTKSNIDSEIAVRNAALEAQKTKDEFAASMGMQMLRSSFPAIRLTPDQTVDEPIPPNERIGPESSYAPGYEPTRKRVIPGETFDVTKNIDGLDQALKAQGQKLDWDSFKEFADILKSQQDRAISHAQLKAQIGALDPTSRMLLEDKLIRGRAEDAKVLDLKGKIEDAVQYKRILMDSYQGDPKKLQRVATMDPRTAYGVLAKEYTDFQKDENYQRNEAPKIASAVKAQNKIAEFYAGKGDEKMASWIRTMDPTTDYLRINQQELWVDQQMAADNANERLVGRAQEKAKQTQEANERLAVGMAPLLAEVDDPQIQALAKDPKANAAVIAKIGHQAIMESIRNGRMSGLRYRAALQQNITTLQEEALRAAGYAPPNDMPQGEYSKNDARYPRYVAELKKRNLLTLDENGQEIKNTLYDQLADALTVVPKSGSAPVAPKAAAPEPQGTPLAPIAHKDEQEAVKAAQAEYTQWMTSQNKGQKNTEKWQEILKRHMAGVGK